MRYGTLVVGVVVCVTALAGSARGQIRTLEARDGHFRETRLFHGGDASAASTVGSSSASVSLGKNHTGAPDRALWIVWSRHNDTDFDLAWSRWSGEGWEPIAWLSPTSDQAGDDLDSNLDFGSDGRPYVAWWRNENGVGGVYFSLFLETHWLAPLRLSVAGVDARHPVISVDADDVITVTYDTGSGTVEQTVTLSSTVGITDDIDPMSHVTVDAPVHVEENSH